MWACGDGRIAAVGDLSRDSARRIVDAKRRTLAPGFIDVHTHVEGSVEKVPGGDNYLMDGVTTVVTGNCGGSEADLGAWFAAVKGVYETY
jgi:N-acyl-D-amino-acid deacylase